MGREVYHLGMFKGLPRGVVVGLLGVVLDIVAVCVREVSRGVSGVRSAVLLLKICLLDVLNICMLLVMERNRNDSLREQQDRYLVS